MKPNKVILSAILASLALAGCTKNPPKQPAYAVVGDPCCVAPIAPVKVLQEPVMMNPVQVSACCQLEKPAPEPVLKPKVKPELLKITGIGYGAESTYQAYTPGQRRLMAIRSSKLDAYRALAEQIYGIKIDSNTSVATLTAKSDSFRARVNAVVRGARVISVTPMADNNYETVLEVYVDKAFFEKAFVYTVDDEEVALDPDDMYKFRTLR